jgi:hypothetical protein
MRHCLLPILLLLAACSSDGTTRDFALSRDSAPQTVASTRLPLSVPPLLASRPTRSGAPAVLVPQQQADAEAGSAGQDALVQAAGPAATADIRVLINENSGMAYPPPDMVDKVMSWTPPPGYTSLTAPASKGWFSRMF